MMAFDKAWRVVKMPILEPQPGIKFGYSHMDDEIDTPPQAFDDMIDASPSPKEWQDNWLAATKKDQKAMGDLPLVEAGDVITYMTPDEYFDIIFGGMYVDEYTENHPGFADQREWDDGGDRWTSTPRLPSETPDQAHDRELRDIIEGIGEGKPMGMPELWMRLEDEDPLDLENYVYDDQQQGGHRMDALRRLGFADTPMPVLQHRRIPLRLRERYRREIDDSV